MILLILVSVSIILRVVTKLGVNGTASAVQFIESDSLGPHDPLILVLVVFLDDPLPLQQTRAAELVGFIKTDLDLLLLHSSCIEITDKFSQLGTVGVTLHLPFLPSSPCSRSLLILLKLLQHV